MRKKLSVTWILKASLFLPCLWQLSGHAETVSTNFYVASVSTVADALPANSIYPQGRRLAFMGYSGKPERDLTNGFTVAGPTYGNQKPYLEKCFAHGWAVVAHLGRSHTFADKSSVKYHVNEAQLRRDIQLEIQPLLGHQEIVWWAVLPEELRPTQPDEMNYLAIVCNTIRQADPSHRPIYLYNPNHRTAETLLPVARHVDLLAKGDYVNHVGRKRERAWIRWSVTQEIEAIKLASHPEEIPLVMPELCQDPEPAEDHEIRSWVRHDVYGGLISGAKGVVIWSLYQRPEVSRTWQAWYDAYAECARELNGETALAQIFLFGERRSDLRVRLLHGPADAEITLGGRVEPTTTSTAEAARRKTKLSSCASAEFVYNHSHWLFLVNSANAPVALSINGYPAGAHIQNVFNHSPVTGEAPLSVELPAYGVVALRFDD